MVRCIAKQQLTIIQPVVEMHSTTTLQAPITLLLARMPLMQIPRARTTLLLVITALVKTLPLLIPRLLAQTLFGIAPLQVLIPLLAKLL
jgi:hypothetical protein